MTAIRLLYFSYTGNVRHFTESLKRYSEQQFAMHQTPIVITKEITPSTDLVEQRNPYILCVPSYVIYSGNRQQEIITLPMKRYLQFGSNRQKCQGIIGNGDKGYEDIYCWTAHHYAQEFKLPMISDFELRGTPRDVEKVYQALVATKLKYDLQ